MLLSFKYSYIFLEKYRTGEAGCRFFSSSVFLLKNYAKTNTANLRKVLKVAIIGVPNAGKSTLINQIVGRNVFAVSRKVHTTRCCARAVMNVDDTQLVFLDTPGIVSLKESTKHHLERSCLVDSENAIEEADIIAVLHDVSNKFTKFSIDPRILRLLFLHSTKHAFLILNKIDAMKSRLDLLDCVRILTKQDENFESRKISSSNQKLNEASLRELVENEVGWSHFEKVFMVSGLTGSGVGDIQIYLKNLAKPGEWVFPESIISDQNENKVIENTVFSKLLDNLPYNIPYNFKIALEYLEVAEDGSITVNVNLEAKRRHINYLVGKHGTRIEKVTADVEQSLRKFYLKDVRVKLELKEVNSFSDFEKESIIN